MSPDKPNPDMRIAYIAGPYRSPHGPADHWTVKQHIHQAEDYARFIAKACGGRVHCHVPQAATAFWSGPDVDEQQWLDGCLALISRLDPARDALLILPGSSESQGTRAESELATSRGLPIFWLPKDRSKLTESVLQPWLGPPNRNRAPDGSPGSKPTTHEAAAQLRADIQARIDALGDWGDSLPQLTTDLDRHNSALLELLDAELALAKHNGDPQ